MKYIQKICSALIVLGLISASLAPVASANSVLGDACKGSSSVICKQSENANSRTESFVQRVISVLLFVAGVIAVIMIIIGGIKYTLSNGDSGQVTSAKNTVLYSVIGLIVAILAYAIVNFAIDQFKNI